MCSCSCCIVNSCCCGWNTLSAGTRIIAIIEIAVAIAALIVNIITVEIGGIVAGVLGILLGLLLFFGDKHKNKNLVLAWLVISLVVVVLHVAQAAIGIYNAIESVGKVSE